MGLAFVPITLLGTSGVKTRGLRSRLRAVQHRPAGRRLARPGDPRDARGEPDEQPASRATTRRRRRPHARRRLPGRLRRGRGDAGRRRGNPGRWVCADGISQDVEVELTPSDGRCDRRDNVDDDGSRGEARLRADAERNRRRLLDAAESLFCERGLEVGVGEIAERAGVGRGTLFRNFPTKEHLIAAIVAQRMNDANDARPRAARGPTIRAERCSCSWTRWSASSSSTAPCSRRWQTSSSPTSEIRSAHDELVEHTRRDALPSSGRRARSAATWARLTC